MLVFDCSINPYSFRMGYKENRKANLAKLVEEYGSANKLVDAMSARLDPGDKLNPKYLNQILSGFMGERDKKPRDLGDKAAAKIEKALGLPANWMDQDHSSPASNEVAYPLAVNFGGDEHEADLVDLGPSLAPRMIPVVGMAQLGDNGFYEELGFPPGDGDGFIQAVTKDVNAYALKVRGNSMHPAIRDGWIVMVEPNREPQIGEFVVVQCADGRKMVKEFLGWRGDELILQSVNENYGRLTLHPSEVRAIQAVGGIHPPSKREIR